MPAGSLIHRESLYTIFAARHVKLTEEVAIERGAVVLDAGGRLVAYGPHDEMCALYPDAPVETIDGLITWGLVNAHTHLELSALGVLAHEVWSDHLHGCGR